MRARPAAAFIVAALCTAVPSTFAQDGSPAPSLEQAERTVAAEFAALEETLLKMARYLRKTEPERADLLVRALNRSREERLEVRLAAVADLLRSDAAAGLTPNFGDAIEEQQNLVRGMRAVLGLLRSEDRREEIDSEQERLQALVKDLGRLIGDQKAAEAANRRGESAERVAGKQSDVTDRTGDLLDRVKEADAAGETPEEAEGEGRNTDGEQTDGEPAEEGSESDPEKGETEPGEPAEGEDGEPSEGESPDGEPSEGDPQDGEPSDSETESGESQSGEPQEGQPQSGEPQDGQPQDGEPQSGQPQDGEPQEGQPQSGQPQQGQPQSGQPQQGEPQEGGEQPPQTPGAEQIEEAKKAMEEAQQELEQAEREGAREKQAEAVRKLTEAKEKLEEILRQLREEEAELVLRALEVRFQKMLEAQQEVLAGTVALAAATGDAAPDAWEQRHVAKARELARAERAIGVEGEKALALLRDDGSSVAFPEALTQILSDISFAADLLAKPRADDLTQSVERDVVAALEEMIDAFRQELEKLREKQESDRQPPGGQQGQPGEEGLVDKIAELKMLRTLQVGVNRRTALLGDDGSGDLDVAARLRELADRQGRIEGAAYDLAVGKNR